MTESGIVEVGLSLGANLGDRLQNLRSARDAIAQIESTQLLASSPVYETEPVGVDEQYSKRLGTEGHMTLHAYGTISRETLRVRGETVSILDEPHRLRDGATTFKHESQL